LRWAVERLGVTDVVFREFSRLHGLYQPNGTQRTIERERVPIESLLEPLLPDGPGSDFEPEEVTQAWSWTRWRASPCRTAISSYRRDRGHVEGEGWSGGAEEGR
jgi:hypothetical protein